MAYSHARRLPMSQYTHTQSHLLIPMHSCLPACLPPDVYSPHSERWSCRNVSPSRRSSVVHACQSFGRLVVRSVSWSGGRFVVFMRSATIVYNVTQRLGNETFQSLLKRECVRFVGMNGGIRSKFFLCTTITNDKAAVKRPTAKQT